jgi:hypothetical protein
MTTSKNQRYYKNNRNELLLTNQNYYEKNKELVNEKRRKKIWCEACQREISHGVKLSHVKSKKHLDNIRIRKPLVIEEEEEVRSFLTDFLLKELTLDISNLWNKSKEHMYKNDSIVKLDLKIKIRKFSNFNPSKIDSAIANIIKPRLEDKRILECISILPNIYRSNKRYKNYYKKNILSSYVYELWNAFYKSLPIDNPQIQYVINNDDSTLAKDLLGYIPLGIF